MTRTPGGPSEGGRKANIRGKEWQSSTLRVEKKAMGRLSYLPAPTLRRYRQKELRQSHRDDPKEFTTRAGSGAGSAQEFRGVELNKGESTGRVKDGEG